MKHLVQEHSGVVALWSALRDSSYTLYKIHYAADSLGEPVLDPGAQIIVAFDLRKGLVVFGFHDEGPLSDVWEMTNLLCGELREWNPAPAFPIRPLVVSSVLPGHCVEASFLPATGFVGANERASPNSLDAVLDAVDVTPQPRLMEYLGSIFMLVEAYAPLRAPVIRDDQTSRWSLIAV